MKRVVSISFPAELAEELDKLARQENISRSDLIRKSVRNYLFVRKFRGLSSKLMGKAQVQGVHTDQDVFDRVSKRSPFWKLIRARRKQSTISLGQLNARLKMKK
jgi:metal-responsive CopG/Arc/MetJ family transcriptional regulator